MRRKGRNERNDTEQPLIDYAHGTYADRLGLIAFLARKMRFPRNYARILRWFLDAGAHHHPVDAHKQSIAESPWVDVSEDTVKRAVKRWSQMGVLVLTDRLADNGAWLPPQAELIWDAVLDHLGVCSHKPPVPAGPGGGDEGPDTAQAAPTAETVAPDREDLGTRDRASVLPAEGDHHSQDSPAPSPTFGRGWAQTGICAQGVGANPNLRPGGGRKSESAPRGWAQIPAPDAPLLSSAWRSLDDVLAHARATVVLVVGKFEFNNNKNSNSSDVTFERVRALAGSACKQVWRDGLWDTAEGRAAQRLLYGASLLALTEFSETWLHSAVEALKTKQRSGEPARDKTAYFVGCLRNACATVEDLREVPSPSRFGQLMGIMERAIAKHLPPLRKRPKREEGDGEPLEKSPRLTAEELRALDEAAAAEGNELARDLLRRAEAAAAQARPP